MNFVVAIAFLVVNWVLNFFAPRPGEEPGSTDISVPNSNQGDVLPKLFGTRFAPSLKVAWWGDVAIRDIRESGGKK